MEKHVLLSKIVKKLLLLFFFSLPFLLIAQSKPVIDFTNITKEEGLLNNKINKTIKDDLGFLWIATNQGLHRYDGPNSITVFKVDTLKNTNSLASNIIRSLIKDSQGNLWIGTSYGGLTRYNINNGEWKTFRKEKDNPSSISNDEILCIYEDSQQRLWIGTEGGLNLFDYQSESFTRYTVDAQDPSSLKAKAVLSIMEDHQGWLWVGTWAGGLHLMLDGDKEKTKFLNFKPSTSKQAFNIWTIFQDRQNRYWIGTYGGGLFLMHLPPNASNNVNQTNWAPNFYNYLEDKNHENSLSNSQVTDIMQDRNGQLWIGTSYGINCIEPKNMPDTSEYNYGIKKRPSIDFNRYYSDLENLNSLPNNTITSMNEDEEGIIWIGTANGLSQYNWYTSQFEFHKIYDQDYIIPNSSNIYIDENQIAWLATGDKGLLNYDLQKKTLQSFSKKHPTLFLDDNIIALKVKENKWLYAASSKGFSIINLQDLTAKKYPTPEWFRKVNPNFYIQALYIDKNKSIWFGTEQGLYVLDQKESSYTIYERNLVEESISDNSVTAIYEDKYGDLWIGTYSGLNRIRRLPSGKLQFTHFFHDSKMPQQSLCANQITSLTAIDDQLYIGTTAGLCSYNLESGQFETYGFDNQKLWIQCLVETEDGNIWASTLEGVFHFNTDSKLLNVFEIKDGIIDSYFSLGSNSIDDLGNIYFGSALGFTRFHPSRIQKNETEPPVYITSLRKISPNGEDKINGIHLKEVVLNHDDYYLAINFAGLNYIQPEKNLFAYQLLGFEDKWHFTKNDNPIIYTNLEPKTYTLKVMASNNSGLWNEVGAVLNIVKKPAYWQTWMFQLGCIIGLMALIFVGVQLYTDTQRKNIKLAQMNEEISMAKLQSLTINMNPHFLFNAFNTLQNFILKNEKRNANQYLTSLSDIIRKLLNNSESIAIPLLEEIEILKAYVNLEKERFVDVIDFKIIVDPNLLDRNPIIPSMIIQPHLENAILHGLSYSNQKGKITLVLTEKEAGNLHCIIRDNGIGRTKAKEMKKRNEHLSMASRNTNDRIDILKKMGYQDADLEIKDLYDNKSLPIGTEIIITLPFLTA